MYICGKRYKIWPWNVIENYPVYQTVTFMVNLSDLWRSFRWPTYCYFVYAADARSVSDSYDSCPASFAVPDYVTDSSNLDTTGCPGLRCWASLSRRCTDTVVRVEANSSYDWDHQQRHVDLLPTPAPRPPSSDAGHTTLCPARDHRSSNKR